MCYTEHVEELHEDQWRQWSEHEYIKIVYMLYILSTKTVNITIIQHMLTIYCYLQQLRNNDKNYMCKDNLMKCKL
jgi:hypothetical protein